MSDPYVNPPATGLSSPFFKILKRFCRNLFFVPSEEEIAPLEPVSND
jgi:hypothetical protein